MTFGPCLARRGDGYTSYDVKIKEVMDLLKRTIHMLRRTYEVSPSLLYLNLSELASRTRVREMAFRLHTCMSTR